MDDADRSLTRMGADAGVGSGEGETTGKVRPAFVVWLGGRSVPAKGGPGGRPPASRPTGSRTPAPEGADGVPAEVTAVARGGPTGILIEADAEAATSGEVPVAISSTRVPAPFCGTATAACSWTGWAVVRATEHTVRLGAVQAVKLGAGLPGLAVMLIFAVPFTWPASRTQILKRALSPAWTRAASAWTFKCSRSEGDGAVREGVGEGDGLGVGVGDEVGVGVDDGLGVGVDDGLGVGVGDGLGVGVDDGLGVGVGDGLGVGVDGGLGAGVALAILRDTAVRCAASGLALAAEAKLALPASMSPASAAGTTRAAQIILVLRPLIETSSIPWSFRGYRVRTLGGMTKDSQSWRRHHVPPPIPISPNLDPARR